MVDYRVIEYRVVTRSFLTTLALLFIRWFVTHYKSSFRRKLVLVSFFVTMFFLYSFFGQLLRYCLFNMTFRLFWYLSKEFLDLISTTLERLDSWDFFCTFPRFSFCVLYFKLDLLSPIFTFPFFLLSLYIVQIHSNPTLNQGIIQYIWQT